MASQQRLFSTDIGLRRGVDPRTLKGTRPKTGKYVITETTKLITKNNSLVESSKFLRDCDIPTGKIPGNGIPDSSFKDNEDIKVITTNSATSTSHLSSHLPNVKTRTKDSTKRQRPIEQKKLKTGKSSTQRCKFASNLDAFHDSTKLLLDCFKTRAVLGKRVNYVLEPSERVASNYTRFRYCIRIAPRFPCGTKMFSGAPFTNAKKTKRGRLSKTHCRIIIVSKVLKNHHPSWNLFRFIDRREKQKRLEDASSVSSSSSFKMSKSGLKVIKQFHLEDVMKKHIQRASWEEKKLRKKNPIRKKTCTPSPVVYREASAPVHPEDQLLAIKIQEDLRSKPSENDLIVFHRYLESGIPDSQLCEPPYKFHQLVSKDLKPSLLRDIRFQLIVENLVKELRFNYFRGVKISIILYALLCPAERQRLGIKVAPYFFPYAVVQAPVPWHQNFITSKHFCHHNIFALQKVLRKLDEVWIKSFSKALFVNGSAILNEELKSGMNVSCMASSNYEKEDIIISPHELEEEVRSQCAATRQLLLTQWLPAIGNLFTKEINSWKNLIPTEGGDSLRQLKRFFHTVRSKMSLQLRKMTFESLLEFQRLLMKHKDGNEYEDAYDESKFVARPVISISLKIVDRHLMFDPPMSETRSCLQRCLEAIVKASHDFPRIERLLFPEMKQTSSFLQSTSYKEETVIAIKKNIDYVFEMNSKGPQLYLDAYKSFQSLLDGTINKNIDEYVDKVGEMQMHLEAEGRRQLNMQRFAVIEEGKKNISELSTYVDSISLLLETVPLGLIQLSCKDLNVHLKFEGKLLISKVLDHFVIQNKNHNKDICRTFDDMSTKLSQVTDVTAEIVELSNFLHECSSQTVPQLLQEIGNSTDRILFLLKHGKVPEDHMPFMGRMYAWNQKIQEDFRLAEVRLSLKRDQKEVALKERIKNFDKILNVYNKDLEDLRSKDNFSMKEIRVETMRRNVELLEKLTDQLQDAKTELQIINEEQSLLSWEITKFPLLHTIMVQKEPFDKLWNTTYDFNTKYEIWYNGPFMKLDAENINEEVEGMWKIMYRLTKTFSDQSQVGSRRVAEYVKERIETFRLSVPILQCICNPGLRERHWKQLGEQLGTPLELTEETSLGHMIEVGLPSIQRKLEEISHAASKEFALEKALEKMKGEWVDVVFEFKAWRETGVSILAAVDDIQVLLDEHTQKVQTMRGSPYIKPFEEEIKGWEDKLLSMQDILDAWVKCQVTWLYLEPIFSSEDIMKQMPVEGRKFTRVDITWREMMAVAVVDPRALVATDQPNMLQKLQESNALLEDIQKGLNDYLEKKRLFFPRFFFLSNDELLEILSETKDPQRVQPHLRKCFQGIDALNFSSLQEIEGMISVDKELVQFSNRVIPGKARGLVEKWLSEVEEMMIQSLQDVMVRAMENYPQSEHKKWILHWPSQVVLTVAHILWTSEVSETILNGGLQNYIKEINTRIEEVVSLVRGDLKPSQRITLGALIVSYVHGRDVAKELLLKNVKSLTDFSWVAQLRYIWVNELVQVHMIMTSIDYGYEYLGNTSRLVMTPLTDRCFRTLMGALKLHLGGAPEGPAGTGKTETCKDLAKAVAKQCIIFNCSEGLDYKAMAKFFKGLAQSGAWACFDEFNRMDLEVLSVVAQQVQTLQAAISRGVKKFMFDGTTLLLNPSCNIFITMNPGYAGRQTLPDNLKVLFRTVTMMVPDYVLISKISLFSMGFVEADSLSRKIIDTYRLCSEQLSSQHHYDYGMRAVKAVLMAAASLKLQYPSAPESQLVLKAIQDVNLPKFLSQDVPLFEGIVKDLFPAESNLEGCHLSLEEAITETLLEKNLQDVPWLKQKIIQLYNMILVRHGVMIVGESLSGKTTAYQTLAAAIEKVPRTGQFSDESNVQSKIINAKSLTLGQLYGAYDPFSHEWSDGVLAKTFREMSISTSDDRKWLIFDGPVDSLWVENLNTALDDNKKLCLMSGEIIQMSNRMTILFEAADLEQASPATVSRCGMVYMESKQLGWRPLKSTYMKLLPSAMTEGLKEDANEVLEWIIPPVLNFVTKKTKMMIKVSEVYLFKAFTRLLDSLLDDIREAGKPLGPKIGETKMNIMFQSLIIFSIPWSIGSTLTDTSRKLFDKFYRLLILGKNREFIPPGSFIMTKGMLYPDFGLVYDYLYDAPSQSWITWSDTIDKDRLMISAGSKLSEVIIPTAESARQEYFLQICLNHNVPLLLVGSTGTGKSAITGSVLSSLPSDKFIINAINFSARTTASQTQDVIMSKVDRRRKGVFGPAMGRKYVVFIDDVNLPQKEEFGAQPPLEFLRQWLDHQYFYDKKDTTKVELVDSLFIAAMGPPGGGRNNISERFLRHMNVFTINSFDDNTLEKIYGTIVKWHLGGHSDSAMQRLYKPLIEATTEVYRKCLSNFLPTPVKSHYVFNLRDYGKLIAGILLVSVDYIPSIDKLFRLWVHEAYRVFSDRLSDNEDRETFFGIVRVAGERTFRLSLNMVLSHLIPEKETLCFKHIDDLVYGDYLMAEEEAKTYDEVQDWTHLKKVMEGYLTEYNLVCKSPMNLVMFPYIIQHVSRVSRVLKQPRGHVLLIGLGGSGRRSVTKLATFIANYELFQIESSNCYGVTEWREDIKRVLLKAGGEGKPSVLLLVDTQLTDESFLEDINLLLNMGDLPNLYTSDEKVTILEKMQLVAKEESKKIDSSPMSLYNFYIGRVRANLHMVFVMSPIGNEFRIRLRMFPSLVNCCTIDWFATWPNDALEKVAESFLKETKLTESLLARCVTACRQFYHSAKNLADKFAIECSRRVYITPTSYLDLIHTAKKLLLLKQTEISSLRQRYLTGLQKLSEAEQLITDLQEELKSLQPRLVHTSANTEALMIKIEQDTIQVEKKKELVAADEAVANKKFADAQAIKDDCEKELAKAVPALSAATEALNTLRQEDVRVVKAMKNPPAGVKMVMEAVCVMLDVKPGRKPDSTGSGKMTEDYWGPSQKLLGDFRLLPNLLLYDKDNISPRIISIVREKYYSHPDFDPKIIRNISTACEGLCRWVRAMVVYDQVIKIVAPKKEALEAANHELALQNEKLEKKRKELREVTDKLQALNDEFTKKQKEKKDLEDSIVRCEQKRDRSERLIGGLGGERGRWSEAAHDLSEQLEHIVGDAMVSASLIAFLGAFTVDFREIGIREFMNACGKLGISCSKNFAMSTTLGDSVQIRTWQMDGLPVDSFSIENALIIVHGQRWPLMIDPQGQANKWIRNMEAKNNLQITKLSDPLLMSILEKAIQLGSPVLIENIREDLDPMLDTILLKQTFKQQSIDHIRLGDAVIEYNPNFRLYATSRLMNPHYLPRITAKVTLINFSITKLGLENQLLGLVVSQERPELEEKKNNVLMESANNRKALQKTQEKILEVLSTAGQNLLEDEKAIEIMSSSRILSQQISAKELIVLETEKEIDKARNEYKPVASHASILFFCVAELAILESVYQYSLSWFIGLYLQSIKDSGQSDDIDQRIQMIKKYLTMSVYSSVSRSLFERHKILFPFMLSVRCSQIQGQVPDDIWQFILVGGKTLQQAENVNPASAWLPNSVWNQILMVSQCQSLSNLSNHVSQHQKEWKEVYLRTTYSKNDLPEPYNKVGDLEFLAIIKCLRPDKVISIIQFIIQKTLGDEFLNLPSFNLKSSFEDSRCNIPTVFILTPGSDPITPLMRFYESLDLPTEGIQVISLGQGQGELAEATLRHAAEEGWWVVLQNCHLAQSWLPHLEMISHEILEAETTKSDFRLWLSSYPCQDFPVSLLQDAIKITNEPPRGLRANLLKSYQSVPISDPEFFNSCDPSSGFQKLLFGLCFFHALVQERKAFGPLGWNVAYEFNDADLRISVLQLQMLITEAQGELPLEALTYLTGECNYGGRVTDEQDRKLLLCLLKSLYNNKIIHEERYEIFGIKEYSLPIFEEWIKHIEHIEAFPMESSPGVFGLHENATLAKNTREVNKLFKEALALEPRLNLTIQSVASTEVILDLASEIMTIIPPLFDLAVVDERHPLSYTQSLNTVLRQEILRYNRLTSCIKSTIKEVRNAIKGQAVLSEELEEIYKALLIGKVPEAWLARSYPTRKGLTAYIGDLIHRLKFFQRWVEDQIPDVFWFSGFFFPHSFLTGIRQNFARKHKIPIDRIGLEFKVMEKEVEDIIEECINPNFVELPEVFEVLASSDIRGKYDIIDTDIEELPSEIKTDTKEKAEVSSNNDTSSEASNPEDTAQEISVIEDEVKEDVDEKSESTQLDDVIYKVIPKQGEGGVYTWGFFLEGARWDRKSKLLSELEGNCLYDNLPIILFQPVILPPANKELDVLTPDEETEDSQSALVYPCPVYRTSERHGTMSTTGHSSNYILDLDLKSLYPKSHWVMRGVAALTQLDD